MEQTEQFSVTYERCRSGSGVPICVFPIAFWEMWEDPPFRTQLIQTVLDAFIPMAKKAHPKSSSMWMPSESPRDYALEYVSSRAFSDLTLHRKTITIYSFTLLDRLDTVNTFPSLQQPNTQPA